MSNWRQIVLGTVACAAAGAVGAVNYLGQDSEHYTDISIKNATSLFLMGGAVVGAIGVGYAFAQEVLRQRHVAEVIREAQSWIDRLNRNAQPPQQAPGVV